MTKPAQPAAIKNPRRALPGMTHREAYPEQYSHPLVGQHVHVARTNVTGTVLRVVPSRFGALAQLDDGSGTYWLIGDLTPVAR